MASKISDKVSALSAEVDENFLELGHALTDLQLSDPDQFRELIRKAGIKERKAYYLVKVYRTFSKIPTSKTRLKKIGWTKLMVLTPHISKSNYAELLKMAETYTAKELEERLTGKQPITNARSVLSRFTPKDYSVLEEALVLFGAKKSGRGMINKEEAMINMAKYAIEAKMRETKG